MALRKKDEKNKEKTPEDTAQRALEQIAIKNYDAGAEAAGIKKDRILHYGIGFSGKDVAFKPK